MCDKRKRLVTRVTEDEYKTIMASIKTSGMTINEFVKRACLGLKIKPMPKEQKTLLLSLHKVLVNISNNCNQIAHIANQQKDVTSVTDDLKLIAEDLDELWQYLKSAKMENQ